VTARLVALVMLPVTAMCVGAGSVVLSRRSTAVQAAAVDHGVIGLSELVGLRSALQSLQSVETIDSRVTQLGVTRAEASAVLGFDVAAQVAPDRAAARRATTSLGNASPLSASTLQSLYAEIDGGLVSPTAAVQRLEGFDVAISAAVTRGLDQLEAQAHQPALVAALESLRAASDLLDVTTPQLIDLSALWFPAPGTTPQATEVVWARFGQESSDYGSAVARMRELGVKSVVAGLGRMEALPKVQAFDQAVAASLQGNPPTDARGPLATSTLDSALRGGLARTAPLTGLVTTATIAVRDEAGRLAASAAADLLIWAMGAAALALASIGVALRLSYSIRKPLKDLASYAHAIHEGELDAEPAPSRHHGPRETRIAFDAFTDVVANLKLLDTKASALARCDFDDPALSERLPGRLGQSLESSVAVLSGSIAERDELQTHLAYEATHDSLTAVSNRPAAIVGIEAAMRRAARTGALTALLYVDLIDFKAVNDSHGHEVGDQVLRQVAARLTAGLRSVDFVARLGGDEFVVLAEGIGGVADASELARRIIDTISEPIEIGAQRISIGAAVGIALTLDGPDQPLRLLARADAAMYRAKHHDRSGVEIFDAALQQQMIEREDIETALTAALADPAGGGLKLQYQPVLDAASGALVSVEALIRWDRPGHGLLDPDSFIPIAEATALIIDLDCWVLNEATRQLVAWSADVELAEVPVAVNISGRHLLSSQLPDHMRAALDQTGVDPHRLTIEITETVLINDLVVAAAELDAVRALGVKVAIDDFGTGYTSLAHLQQLPIDTIKIDRSFVSQLNGRRGSSLVRMVTDLGHAIDINIVAEGVETNEEMTALQAMGADHLQGFLLSRPLEPAALATWIHGRAAATGQTSASTA
jgi:diguanylate cyclase (GGDEF)-like protein